MSDRALECDHASPLLRAKSYEAPSVFQPANQLREGRRQLGRPDAAVPAVCLLDPDGDIVRHRHRQGGPASGLGLLPHGAVDVRPRWHRGGRHRVRSWGVVRCADRRA
ncbi:MAG: hypothetical protein WAX12_12960, partial [Candidatus Microthrix subdominans]